MKKFIEELKRRHVIKSTVAYLVFAWLLLQVSALLLPVLKAPEWLLETITLILAIGLPIWIVISWVYQITPKGIEKTTDATEPKLESQVTNRRLNAFIIAGLSVAVIILTLKLSFPSSKTDRELSIAVIPFDNIRVDKDNEWLSMNYTENVHTYLSKVRELLVIDSYSSRQYQDTDKTNAQIGEELDVSYLLRAALTQLEDRLTIKIELIDVNTNKVDWSDTYHEVLEGDHLRTHQQIAQKIVEQLRVVLTEVDKNTLNTLLTKNQEASIYFNEGVRVADYRNPYNQDSISSVSVALFQKAIDIDPDYADAYAETAFILRMTSERHELFNNTNRQKTLDSLLNKSLELDPNNVRAYVTLGMLEADLYNNFKTQKDYYDKALLIKPNDATLHHYLFFHYRDKPEPDLDKALEHIKIAQRLNPFSRPILATLIQALLIRGNIEEAEQFARNGPLSSDDYIKKSIFEAKLEREVDEKKDWRIALEAYKKEIEKDSTDAYYYRQLGIAYNEILNDSELYLDYARQAYTVARNFPQNDEMSFWSSNAELYFDALLKNHRYGDAEQLLMDDYFVSLFDESNLNYFWTDLNYDQKKYETAEQYAKRSPFDMSMELLMIYAQQDNPKKIDSIFKIVGSRPDYKAIVFAIREERDSMYHYLNMEIVDFRPINGFSVFDPYRKEERFKTLLRKNYLPITHWNE